MTRTVILATCLLTGIVARTQTYFYIDAITVQPAAPTTADVVQLDLSGGLSSTGAHVVNTSALVQEHTVTITIAAADPGGATVIVPHMETVLIGMLPAGEYHIVIDGTAVGDFADQADHVFTVTDGTECEGLVIERMQWTPFSDTAVILHVFNTDITEIFDYPGFVLLHANGDTIAKETVSTFGIGLESWHTLTVHPGMVVPSGTFNAALHLWTLFYGEQACTWEFPENLCPATCDTLYPNVGNFGDALSIGTYAYTIRDTEQEEVASGVLEMTDTAQYDMDTFCVPPGSYTMTLLPQDEPTGGQPRFGIQGFGLISGGDAPVLWSDAQTVDFDFMLPCASITQGIGDHAPIPTFRVTATVNGLLVHSVDGLPLGPVALYDAQGKLVASDVGASHTVTLRASTTTSFFVVLVRGAVQKVILVQH